MIGTIYGTGSYVPEKVLDNHDLSKMVETSDEWITERTGIKRRHLVEQEGTVKMASEAGRRALKDARIDASKIDLILVSTITPDRNLPCTACQVQDELGAWNATCFDLNAACTGFLFAYNTAQAYLHTGIYKNALVIGAEAMSTIVDFTDRGTCILFGDGAGAAVLCADKDEELKTVTRSDGRGGIHLSCEPGEYIHMNGSEIFKFAVREVTNCIEELLEKNNLKAEDVDFFILHQANKRIVEAVAKRLKVDIDKFPMNLQEYGNTSSASIPILLDEVNKKGMLERGMKLVMSGFGAGLTLGATLVNW